MEKKKISWGQVQGRLDLGILLNRLVYQNSGLKNNIFSIKKRMEKMPAYTAFYALLLRNLTKSLIEKKLKSKDIISKIFFESAGFI